MYEYCMLLVDAIPSCIASMHLLLDLIISNAHWTNTYSCMCVVCANTCTVKNACVHIRDTVLTIKLHFCNV